MNTKYLGIRSVLSLVLLTPLVPAFAAPAANEDKDTLTEVIVTAQKKSERLQDVPIPITGVNTRTDLHAGINYGDWTGRLYANNVTNRRGLLNGGPSSLIPDSYYYITPRTIGLLVSKKF